MTFTSIPPRRCRVQRSELAVPATSPHFFEKAARSAADVVFLDLEDAVAPARKAEARKAAIEALNDIDWGRKVMAVRINGFDTEWGLRDLFEVASQSPRLDMILAPKVGTEFDIRYIDATLTAIEREQKSERRIGIEALIETTLGLSNVEAIAQASPRLEALIFGIGDYTIDLRTCGEIIGASDPRYAVLTDADSAGRRERHWNDQFHFALARIANVCRAYGLRAIDGPYANFGDAEGYSACAARAAALGCEGKWAIHPSQVPLANAAFSPSAKEVDWATGILGEIESAKRTGAGAFGRDGVLIDMAVEKIARAIIARHEGILRGN